MRNMRAVSRTMSVSCYVMGDVFVNWSNMLAGFVSRTIAGRETHRVMLREALVVS